MAEVKWIKIVTDIFDDEKILLIESMPEADAIIVIWFKLLCLAGKNNNSGVFILNDKIYYTDEMLSTVFRRPLNIVRLALNTFSKFGMIEIVDDVITIPNWSKHQNLDQIEERNEYMKKYMQKYREKQKLIAEGKVNSKVNSKSNSKVNVNPLEVDIEVDKELEREVDKEVDKEKINICWEHILVAWNDLPQPIKPIKAITDIRKTKIKARINNLHLKEEDIIQAINNILYSDFLQGKNSKGWTIEFDWLFKDDTRFSKVLEGNYNNKNASNKNYNKNVQAGIDLIKQYENEQSEGSGKPPWDLNV